MPAKPPNILLLFTDQQRFDTIADLGNPIIRTPVLDRLVQEGTAFTRAYTPSPVCVSARCALLTGMPPHRTGCVDNMPMPQHLPSLMEALRQAGYQTCGIGKMHFVPDAQAAWGFDRRVISEEGSAREDEFRRFLDEQGYDYVQDIHGVRSEYYYLPQPSQLPARLHHTRWVAERSIDFLKNRQPERPFFLWTSFIKPHPPFENPVPWNKLYRAAEIPPAFMPTGYESLLTYWNRVQNRYKYRDAGLDRRLLQTLRAAYWASISFIDENIGRILEAVGPALEDTLIVFTSDHGELLGDYGSFGKRCMLDPAVRIPLLARWPGHFAAGMRCSRPASLVDLWPTFLAAAGSPGAFVHPEGADLLQVADRQAERRYVFSQFSHRALGLYMVTDGRWKYIYSAADEKEWLFNLKLAPLETHNLAANPLAASEISRLRGALLERFQRDDYISAVDGNGWRRYGRASFPEDADEGFLFQDPPQTQTSIDQLGIYARPVTVPDDISYRLLQGPARDSQTG